MENVRRGDVCPNGGLLYCINGFECPECGRTCAEIWAMVNDYMFINDINNDGYVNPDDLGMDLIEYTEFYTTCD